MQSYLSPMDGKRKKKGLWTAEEDRILMDYISVHGTGRWNHIAKATGLKRSGKSCRLRWMNYLCPSVKRGDFTEDEDDLIIRLHNLLGNRWALIAGRIPGRTDNQVKNYWNTHLSKKLGMKRNKYNVGDPSVIVSPPEEERDDPLKIPEDQTADITSGPQVKDGQENDTIRVYEPCEQIMSDCYINSYLVYDDNLEVISPCLTELLDGFPHDLPWLGV